jgi:CHASE2 domain-containing sensor protein
VGALRPLLARLAFLGRPAWRSAGLGFVCALAAWLLALTPPLAAVDDGVLDAWFSLRGVRSRQANIVLVGLDEPALDDLGKPSPYLSPELAAVVRHLRGQGAVAIGIDLSIPESMSKEPDIAVPGSKGDATTLELEVIQAAGKVVLPELRVGNKWQRPLEQWCLKARTPEIAEPTDLAFVNLTEDPDGLVRRQQLLTRDDDGPVPQFAFALLCRARGKSFAWDNARRSLQVGDEPIPLDAEQTLRIDFVGPPGTFRPLRFGDVLADARANLSVPEAKGAVVIIGLTGLRGQDEQSTAYANAFARSLCGRHPELMAGSELQANVLATLLDRAYITEPGWRFLLPFVLVSGALIGAGLACLAVRPAVALALGYSLGWLAVSFAAFAWGNWRIEVVAVLLTGLLTGTAVAVLRRRTGTSRAEATPGRLQALKAKLSAHPDARLTSFRDDLQALEQLAPLDAPGALNKVRYITEKVLHQLCLARNVSWGQAEPTLERMIGPLVAAGWVPKNMAAHVRTIQAYSSPGSHYQESPLSQAHVRIAQEALVELLDWYVTAASGGAPADSPG